MHYPNRPSRPLSRLKTSRAILVAGIASLVGVGAAHAQISLTTTTYSQDFDSMTATGTSTPSGWFNGTGTAGVAGTTVVAGTGSANGGNFYNFGVAGTNLITDRALGSLASSSTVRNTEVRFTNNLTAPITSFTLSYIGEQWRAGGGTAVANLFDMKFGNDGITFVDMGANFDFTSPITPGTAGALDGNAPANRTSISLQTYTPTSSIGIGSTFYIRWVDIDNPSSDHALAIDDFAISFTLAAVLAPQYWDTNGITPGIGGAGIWDNAATNWSSAATGDVTPIAYVPANPVIFGGTAGAVTVDAGGVSADAGIEIQTEGYEISGGALTLGNSVISTSHAADTTSTISAPVGGSVGLTKAGTGTLLLGASNSFTGNVSITGGKLSIANDNRLGTTTNDVSFGGGALVVSEDIILDAGRDVSGNGNLEVDATKTLTVSGIANFSGLTLSGPGTVVLNGATRTTGDTAFTEGGTLSGSGVISAGNISYAGTGSAARITAPLDLGAGTRTVNVADGAENTDLTIESSIKITGGSGSRLHKLGSGTLRLEGDNTGTNGLSGSLRIGTAGASPAAGGTVVITNNKALGGTALIQLQFNAGVLRSTTDMTGANAIALGLSIGGGDGVTPTFAGSPMEFTGTSAFFKSGNSTTPITTPRKMAVETDVILSGLLGPTTGSTADTSTSVEISGPGSLSLNGATNTHEQPIAVTEASLFVNGALTASTATISVADFGILGGGGSIAGNTVLGLDTVLSPGAKGAVGTLTFGGTLNISAALDSASPSLEFGLGSVASSDTVNLSTLALTIGNEALEFSDFSFTALVGFGPGVYPLFTTGTAIDGALGANLEGTIAGFDATISFADSNSDVILTVVPEPGSTMLLLGGLAMLGARRRRKA